MKKFVCLFFLLFFAFLTFRCWTVHDVFVFRSDVAGDVYVPTFYPATDKARLHFNEGISDKSELQPSGQLLVKADGLSAYRVDPNSSFCKNGGKLCIEGWCGDIVLSGSNKNGPITTSSFAMLSESDTSLWELRKLIGKNSQKQRIFIVSLDEKSPKIEELSGDNGVFSINLRKFASFSPKLSLFAFLTAAIITIFSMLLLSKSALSFFRALYDNNRFSTCFVVVWWLVFYSCVFPAIFAHDTVISNANSQNYTDWYSGMYFIYTSCIRIVGFNWIQFLPAVLGLLSALLVLRCGSLALTGHPLWQKRLLSALTVGMFVCNPAAVVTMFAQQRYFVVIDLAIFAISLWCYVYFEALSQNRTISSKMVAFILFLTGLAWLLRSEYLVIFAAAILFFGAGAVIQRKNKNFVLRRSLLIFLSICSIFSIRVFINHAVTHYYHYDRGMNQYRYGAVSEVAMSYPYICGGVVDQKLSKALEYFAPPQNMCQLGPEQFWWEQASLKTNYADVPAIQELHRVVYQEIKADFWTFLRYRITTGKELLFDRMWQMDGQYYRRDLSRATGNPIDVNTAVPDDFGLIRDHPLTRGLNRQLTALYGAMGNSINLTGLVIVAVVTILSVATGLVWLTPSFSLLFLLMTVPIVALSPTRNWAYIGFLPFWASLVLPLSICEGVISQRYLKRHALRGHWASLQQFVRFAGLSGAGWVLDTVQLLVLTQMGHIHPIVANTVSSCVAAGMVFLVSRTRIHGGEQEGVSGRVGIYIAYTLVLILVASCVLSVLVRYLTGLHLPWLSGDALLLVAKIMITPPQLICNFFVSRFVARYAFAAPNR